MRHLLTAALLLAASATHAQLIGTNGYTEARITTLGGDVESGFAFPVVGARPPQISINSFGGAMETYSSSEGAEISNWFGGFYSATLSPFGASLELLGDYTFTLRRKGTIELWVAAESVDVELTGPDFYRQWLATTYFDEVMLPAGDYQLRFTVGYHNDGSLTAAKTIPHSGVHLRQTGLVVPEPTSVVLVLAGIVAVGYWRYRT